MRSFQLQYTELLSDLLIPDFSAEELNKRTGHKIRALRHAAHLTINLEDGNLPVPGNRRVHPRTAAAEVAWFVQGKKDVTWLKKYAPIWDKFVEDDGFTIEAAYGYRWKRHFYRDQLERSVQALRANPTDRRIYISTWDPASDGLGEPGQRNVPCPVGFTLSIVDGKLNSSILLRSSDVFVGLPYDVMGHAMLMAAIRGSLGSVVDGLGTMSVTLAHPHLYDSHYDMARHSLGYPRVDSMVQLSGIDLWGIEVQPDLYVELYSERAKETEWPWYNPRPEVVL